MITELVYVNVLPRYHAKRRRGARRGARPETVEEEETCGRETASGMDLALRIIK